MDDQDPDIADWDPATALRWEREIARDGEGKNIGDDKKDRRKRESGSKRRDGVERKGKGIAKKGETTKGTALQLLPGAPEMMSLSSKPEPKTLT